MFREIVFLCVAALLANEATAQRWGLGSCPDLGTLTPVDIPTYIANPWFYWRTVTNFLENGNRCSKQTLFDAGSPTPSVDNFLTYKIDALRGSSPARLDSWVYLNSDVTGGLELVRANYLLQALIPFVPIYYLNLAYVDDSWTIVYACQPVIPGLLRYELGWIMSRTRSGPSPSEITAIQAKLTGYGLDLSLYDHIEDQTGCPT